MEYRWIGSKPFARGRTISRISPEGKAQLVWVKQVEPGETFTPTRAELRSFPDKLERVTLS